MTRKVNAETLSHIKRSEGLRLTAYPDPGSLNGNPWTIGYGSTKGVKKGDTIDAAEAELRLVEDLEHAENTVERLVKVPLNDNQFGALVSFVFNVGATAFRNSTLLRRLNLGEYDAVPEQLRRWTKNDGKEMKGLVRRREAEISLWKAPVGARVVSGTSTPERPSSVSSLKPDAKTILKVQQTLRDLGYSEVGKVDGKMGPLTETAILAFRKDNNLTLSAKIDDQLLVALAKAPQRELSVSRLDASPKDVREQVPEARNSFRTKVTSGVAAVFSGAGFLVTGVLDNLSGARSLAEPLMDFFSDIPLPVYFLLILGVAAFLWWQSRKGERSIIDAFQTAERR